MEKDLIQQVISHIKNEGLLSEAIPVTEEEFLEKLYINSSDRREILKALMSLFSEDYKRDLKRLVSLDNELALKMHGLGFVTKEKQFHFVMGKCSEEEQQAIYEKLFKSLHFVLIAEEYECNRLPYSSLTEKLPKQTSHHKLEFEEIEESKLSELSSTAESFRLTMERHVPLSSGGGSIESQIVPVELGSAVGKLHSILEFVADATKSSSSEGIELKKKFDLAKMLVQAGELDNNSVVSRCFSRNINYSNENTSTDE